MPDRFPACRLTAFSAYETLPCESRPEEQQEGKQLIYDLMAKGARTDRSGHRLY